MIKIKSLLAAAVLLLAAHHITAQEVSEKTLKKHVSYLASDKLKGRGTGTPEEKMAAEYIAKQFKKIGLAPKGDKGTYFHKFNFKKSSDPHGGVAENAPQVASQNVAGYLDNGAEYTIVIGGHYDHLGLGHDHNSLDANPVGKIHNGADDNASGIAGVIELARYLSKNDVKESHNFLFLCFSGEELGLIGSKRYAEYPTIDLGKVSFMINMDMIGRLNEEKKLVVGGVGTAPDFDHQLTGAFRTGLWGNKDDYADEHPEYSAPLIQWLFAYLRQLLTITLQQDTHAFNEDLRFLVWRYAPKTINRPFTRVVARDGQRYVALETFQ